MADLSSASASYKLYVQNAIELAKTIVIKHSLVNDAINTALIYQGYDVNLNLSSNDPNSETPWRTWKYYQNLAGLYYVDSSGKTVDTPMTVLSVVGDGSVQPIPFDIFHLAQRPATLRAYQYGSFLYNALVTRFPQQEQLIQGILNAASLIDTTAPQTTLQIQTLTNNLMDSFYNAADGTIVAYSNQFIETQETDIMDRIQSWVSMFFRDWFNPQYAITDDMYVVTALGVLYSMLPNIIMNIRLSNCHTIRAHSFHIQQYLESSGQLGQYVPYMNTYQMLWLYRNIKWVQRNAGKQSTFETLIQNIMTQGDLPLSGYDIEHDLTPMINDVSLVPNVILRSLPLNFQDTLNASQLETVNYIVTREAEFSRDNNLDIVDTENSIIEQMQTSVQSMMTTKVLESIYENTIDAVTYPLTDILFNYWPYLASMGMYETDIYVTPPGMTSPILLSPLNAFILYIYAWAYGNNITANNGVRPGLPFVFENIPQFRVDDVLTFADSWFVVPTRTQAAYVVDNSVLPLQYYGTDGKALFNYSNEALPIATDVITQWYTVDPIQKSIDIIHQGLAKSVFPVTSPDQFYKNCQLIQETMMASRDYASTANGFKAFNALRYLGKLPYTDVLITLAPANKNNPNYATNTSYSTWLQDLGISFENVSPTDAAAFAYQVLEQATGANLQKNYSIGEIQAAMLKVMERLSSYSVQYIQTNNSTAGIIEDAAVVQVGYWNVSFDGTAVVALPTARTMDENGAVDDQLGFDLLYKINDSAQDQMDDSFGITYNEYVVPADATIDTMIVPSTARVMWTITDPDTVLFK